MVLKEVLLGIEEKDGEGLGISMRMRSGLPFVVLLWLSTMCLCLSELGCIGGLRSMHLLPGIRYVTLRPPMATFGPFLS